MKFVKLFPIHYRLIVATAWGFFISSIENFVSLTIVNGVILALFVVTILSSHEFTKYAKKWLKLASFCLCLLLTLCWKIDINGFQYDDHGVHLAYLIILRTHLLVISLWLLLFHISEQELTQGIVRLPLPKKFRYLFILTVRYIAVLAELNQSMDMAMKARGFQVGFNKRSFYVLSQRVALLLIHALNKVEKSELALKARGFKF